jgi:phosphoglycolate phosphatase-like HAD superfamily hydrolase
MTADRNHEQLVVGFDLDMTLVDSSAGIVDALVFVCDSHGVDITREEALATIGLPLDQVFPMWLPEYAYEQLLDEYRDHYGKFGIPKTKRMAGAIEAIETVHELNGRVVVVSAKKEDFARRVLDVAGLEVEAVYGYLFAEHKGDALRHENAHIYVGDHPGDVLAARAAGAVSVVVISEASNEEILRAAQPDVVMHSLEEFPAWIHNFQTPTQARHH